MVARLSQASSVPLSRSSANGSRGPAGRDRERRALQLAHRIVEKALLAADRIHVAGAIEREEAGIPIAARTGGPEPCRARHGVPIEALMVGHVVAVHHAGHRAVAIVRDEERAAAFVAPPRLAARGEVGIAGALLRVGLGGQQARGAVAEGPRLGVSRRESGIAVRLLSQPPLPSRRRRRLRWSA